MTLSMSLSKPNSGVCTPTTVRRQVDDLIRVGNPRDGTLVHRRPHPKGDTGLPSI